MLQVVESFNIGEPVLSWAISREIDLLITGFNEAESFFSTLFLT